MKVNIGDYKKDGTRKTKVKISRDDIYSLDATLALVILPALKKYRENEGGRPCDISEEEWHEIIDKMIKSFQMKIDDDTWEDAQEMQEGFELFGEWYQNLWI